MRIAVLGAGAMGSLYAGYLSRCNDVVLVGNRQEAVDRINADGIRIHEKDGSVTVGRPQAVVSTQGLAPVELIVVFVKSMSTGSALEGCAPLIGQKTCILTLQNGSGHEEVLSRFVPLDRVLIGTTQHNSAVLGPGEIRHGGSGMTHLGCVQGDAAHFQQVADAFTASGLEADCSNEVRRLVWNKLFTNASLSVLTGILQVPMGFITRNPSAWALCETLVREAVAVAAADGYSFDADEKVAEVRSVGENGPNGITSICADLGKGRLTEVDTISGSVVRASRRLGVPAPTHEAMVALVHAMEGKAQGN